MADARIRPFRVQVPQADLSRAGSPASRSITSGGWSPTGATATTGSADAFHVVVPDLPGFAFSGPTREPGWNQYRTAAAWVERMRRLGYQRYGAHGNDGGSMISPEVGRLDPEQVIGVHVTQLFSLPSGDPAEFEGPSEEDMRRLAERDHRHIVSWNDYPRGGAPATPASPALPRGARPCRAG